MTNKNQEKLIRILQNLGLKINKMSDLSTGEKTYLSAMISNQIHIESGSAEIVTYADVPIYGLEVTEKSGKI